MDRSRLARRVRRGLAEPRLVVREANRWYYRYLAGGPPDGVDFFGADWDNMLVLDACRYDAFAERHSLPGTLESRRSQSSSTAEWLATYVDGADHRDTVYVTANPQLHWRQDEIDASFHDVVDVWSDEGWDDERKSVPPDAMADAAEAALDRYPRKRLLVHFVQPHYPYLGPTGRTHFDLDRFEFPPPELEGRDGVDDRTLRRAYDENLDLALESVDRLLTTLSGKTVVTADHGEMLGERARPLPMKEYGHPAGIYTEELTRIPWHVHAADDRRWVIAGEAGGVDHGVAETRLGATLSALGYR